MPRSDLTKPTITRAEYLQLLGLHALARRHVAQMKEIEDAIAELIGDESERQDYALELPWEEGERAIDEWLEAHDIRVLGEGEEGPTDG